MDTAGSVTAPPRGAIDLHAHLLHAVDDGPATMEDAIALVRALERQGVVRAAATPHVNGRHSITPALIPARLTALREALAAAGILVDVVAGAEVDLEAARLMPVNELRNLALGGSTWILLETPHRTFPFGLAETVADLGAQGLRCLVAHPERNPHAQDSVRFIEEAVGAGALVQLTGSSLLGRYGDAVARVAWTLAERSLAHLVATDAHHIARRPPRTREAADALAGRMGAEMAVAMTESVPAAILAGASQDEAREHLPEVRRGRRWRVTRRA